MHIDPSEDVLTLLKFSIESKCLAVRLEARLVSCFIVSLYHFCFRAFFMQHEAARNFLQVTLMTAGFKKRDAMHAVATRGIWPPVQFGHVKGCLDFSANRPWNLNSLQVFSK